MTASADQRAYSVSGTRNPRPASIASAAAERRRLARELELAIAALRRRRAIELRRASR